MKKLLRAMTIFGLSTASTLTTIACNSKSENKSDLAKSFDTKYSTTQTDTGIEDFGLTKTATAGQYQYSFKDVDKVGLLQLIVPKDSGPIKKVILDTVNKDFNPVDTEAALITTKTEDGMIQSTGDNNTISIIFTLHLWKVELVNNDAVYIDQNQAMDVTVNVINSPFDISDVTVKDPGNILAITSQTYDKLDTSMALVNLINNAINAKQPNTITAGDRTHFNIENNQVETAMQVAGQVVTFTVKAVDGDQLIKSTFSFTITLQADNRADISSVQISDTNDVQAYANDDYSGLNFDDRIIKIIVDAINTKAGITIDKTDISITNNQVGDRFQTPGQAVIFTVKGQELSSKIEGQFTFTETLKGPAVANLSIGGTAHHTIIMDGTKTYGDLNKAGSDLFTSILPDSFENILSGLSTQVKLDTDYTVTNDHPEANLQQENEVVEFTITATPTSQLVVNSYSFKLQLVKQP